MSRLWRLEHILLQHSQRISIRYLYLTLPLGRLSFPETHNYYRVRINFVVDPRNWEATSPNLSWKTGYSEAIFVFSDFPSKCLAWLTNQVTKRSTVLFKKLTVPQLVERFSTFYETRNLLSCPKQPAICPILYQINPVHALPNYFLRCILILSYNLRVVLPSGLFPSGSSAKNLYAFFFSPCSKVGVV